MCAGIFLSSVEISEEGEEVHVGFKVHGKTVANWGVYQCHSYKYIYKCMWTVIRLGLILSSRLVYLCRFVMDVGFGFIMQQVFDRV